MQEPTNQQGTAHRGATIIGIIIIVLAIIGLLALL